MNGSLSKATPSQVRVLSQRETGILRPMPTQEDSNHSISIPLRRMTQTELDTFLEKAADILRGNVDHSEFRGYVCALLFFKRISDIFEEAIRNLTRKVGEDLANDPAIQKKSLPFVVPADSMWEVVTTGTKDKPVSSLTLGQSLNDAMLTIERANAPKFDGILTNKIDFNKQDELPRSKLVQLKNHVSSRKFDRANVPDDLFGDAYEYLISTFASNAGKSSGEFYTPKAVSYLMSEIVEPGSNMRSAIGPAALARWCFSAGNTSDATTKTRTAFKTLLASVDVIMTKPGHGTFVEAVALQQPVVYVRRYNFADEPPLVDYLHRYGRGIELSLADFTHGRREPAISKTMATLSPPTPPPPSTSAMQAASILVPYLNRTGA
jgi:hypothetical protein